MKKDLDIEIDNAEGNVLEVTLRGESEHIIQVLVKGLPHGALLHLNTALAEELAKRRAVDGGGQPAEPIKRGTP